MSSFPFGDLLDTLRAKNIPVGVADYQAAGFTVVPGGRHPGRNTRNALVVFHDGAYIELIAYDAPSPEERWWRVLAAHGEGLVDFALLPQDIADVLAAARARGLADTDHRNDGLRSGLRRRDQGLGTRH